MTLRPDRQNSGKKLGVIISRSRRRAFSLVELLVVLAIISVLSAILLPVFLRVQSQARRSACHSNLRQIGLATSLYLQDYDGFYPHAIDPVDPLRSAEWSINYPLFGAEMNRLQQVHILLRPYVGSPNLFACPADIGFTTPDYLPVTANALPTSYEKFGTSYYYRTELAARHANDSMIEFPSQINVQFELVGFWHGGIDGAELRYSTLFADGHVSSLSRAQTDHLWETPLNSSLPAPLQD